jgi:murein DD-endopeptidase MepM/ murein hydrolase activator NlpD
MENIVAQGYTPDNPVSKSPFGFRVNPVTGVGTKFHGGQDWGAAPGTPVKAASDGTVWFSGFNASYGNTIIVRHGPQ